MSKFVIAILLTCISSAVFAQDAKVIKVLGGSGAYLVREGIKQSISEDLEIEQGDEVFSEDAVLLIHLFPSTQLSLTKNSRIKIDQNFIEENSNKEKSVSVISFIQGLIRIRVTKDANEELEQKVQAENVAFAVRGTDYEISLNGDEVDLDVHKGAVEVSSPFVMTFVPEIVKEGKGFRFNRKQRNFATRKFGPRFKNHPGFLKKVELRERWMKVREARKARKLERQARKDKKIQGLQERREIKRSKRGERKNRR